MEEPVTEIAIIGAGVAGATLVHQLSRHPNINITVFDKSRGIGGRMSTRYGGDYEYDHGAQFFTARTKAFQTTINEFVRQGAVVEWQPKVVTLSPQDKPYKRMWYEPHFVSQPRMNDFCKLMLTGQEIERGTRITEVNACADQYSLIDDEGCEHGPFDWVISTAPAEQTAALMPESVESLSRVRFRPCFALMLPWSGKHPGWDAATVKDSPLAWLCFNHRRPGRTHEPCMLVHSSGEWAEANFDQALDVITAEMLSALSELIELPPAPAATVHRWRYARTLNSLDQPYWCSGVSRLAACGDWCLGANLEDAFTSAVALARALHHAISTKQTVLSDPASILCQ